ncbi:hypothetical protein C0J52_14923 [Blattella germanica]|nr:hypothetical protein C0J52_14923 [Blattella germanica]
MLEEIFEDNLIGDPNDLEEIIELRAEEEQEDNPQDEENDAENNENNENNSGTGGTQEEPKKKRIVKNPQPKLNPERLKGPRGIAILEDSFKDFEYLGKGHERTDLNRVMKRLEHWAHRLFPRFQFDDCLEKIEKLGQKKPVQLIYELYDFCQVYVKRIRMGLETGEEPVLLQEDDEDDPFQNATDQPIDAFDALLTEQLSELQARRETPVPSAPPTPVQPMLPPPQQSPVLTAEQRERMLKNRILAEERRLARMKAKKEMEKVAQEDSLSVSDVSPICAVPANQISDKESGNLNISTQHCSKEMGVCSLSSEEQTGIASNKESNVTDISITNEYSEIPHITSLNTVQNCHIASKTEAISTTSAEDINTVASPIVNISDSTLNSSISKINSVSTSDDDQLNKIKSITVHNEQEFTKENSSSMFIETKQNEYTSVSSGKSVKGDADQKKISSVVIEAEENSSVSTIMNDEQNNKATMIMDAEESTNMAQNDSVSMTIDHEENNGPIVTDDEQINHATTSTDDEQCDPTAMLIDDEESNAAAMLLDGNDQLNITPMSVDNKQSETSNDDDYPVLQITEQS